MFIILWLIFCILVGAIASSRGQSGILAFIVSAIFSPILGLIVVLLMPDNSVKKEMEELKTKVNNLEKGA